MKELTTMKNIASEGINKTPYVQLEWSNGEKAALLDTGAQWSLICMSKLTEEEKQNLNGGKGLSGRGVSGERIDILGEVWRNTSVGCFRMKNPDIDIFSV